MASITLGFVRIAAIVALATGCATRLSTQPAGHEAALTLLDEASRAQTQRDAWVLAERAIDELGRLGEDSGAEAKALLAETLLVLHLQDDASRARARHLAEKALALDPQAARAHGVVGWLAFFEAARFAEALIAFERALALEPDLPFSRFGYGLALAASGDLARGLSEVERAERSRLVRPTWRMGSQSILFFMRRYADAAQRAREALAGSPASAPDRFWEGVALIGAGDSKAAVAALEARVSESNRIPGAVAMLATAYVADGQAARARALLPEMQGAIDRTLASGAPGCSQNPCYLFALAHLALGDRDAALQMLERAVNESEPGVWYLWANVDPRWDSLRQDPRFAAIIRKGLHHAIPR